MLGVTATGTRTLSRLVSAAAAVPHAHPETVAVSAAVILVMLVARRIVRRLPGALIAVIGEIIVGRAADLARHGVAVIGPVPRGLPPLGLPALSLHDATGLLGAAASMFVVILAQSAATSRVYAAKHGETFSPQSDLLGLGAANVAAAFSGTFVVNGSPTQTQVADSAGARGQLAQLTTSAVVVLVLLFATGLAYLPVAALAAVVFLIGVQLIDVSGMRRILSVRRNEFIIALLTAAAVVFLGVQEGIVLAVVASIIDHLRHTYHPRNSVLVKSPAGHWHATPVRPGARTEKRLAVYRFSTDLYYANAARLQEDVTVLTGHGEPLLWLVLDGAAIGDVHYTAALVLTEVIEELRERHIRFVVTSIIGPVRRQLDRYGISAAMGHDAYYTPGCSAGGIPRRPPAPRRGGCNAIRGCRGELRPRPWNWAAPGDEAKKDRTVPTTPVRAAQARRSGPGVRPDAGTRMPAPVTPRRSRDTAARHWAPAAAVAARRPLTDADLTAGPTRAANAARP